MDAPDLVPLRCPTCSTEFDVGHLVKGTRTFCPKCRTIVTVPGARAEAAVAAPAPAPAPETPPPVPPVAPAVPEIAPKPVPRPPYRPAPPGRGPSAAVLIGGVAVVGILVVAVFVLPAWLRTKGQTSSHAASAPSGGSPTEATPSKEPAAPKLTVALSVNSESWRQGGIFDVAGALRKSLEVQGMLVVPSEGRKDAAINVVFAERRGPLLTNGATVTVFEMTLAVFAPDRPERLLILHAYGSAPAPDEGRSATQDALYQASLRAFQESPGFVHAGTLVGAALGVRSCLPNAVEALLHRETRDVALDVLEKNNYRPTDPRGQAAVFLAREDYEECKALGKPAAEVLCRAFEEFSDYDRAKMARVMGDLGDVSCSAFLARMLVAGVGSDRDDRGRDTLLAVIEALGRVGDQAAEASLQSVAENGSAELSEAASKAVQALESRLSPKR